MQSGDCLPGFTNQCGESSPDRQAMRRVPPELSKPMRRVIPNCPNQCGESSSDRRSGNEFPQLPQPVRRVSRTVQTNAASRPGLYQPVRRVPPDRHAGIELLRLHRTVQTNAASYPPKVTQFAGLRSEQKQLTALTIGNEGIQMQWHSRAHTRKHEAALPPVLMFFL